MYLSNSTRLPKYIAHAALVSIFISLGILSIAQSPARTGTDYAIFFVVQDFDAWPDFPKSSTQQVQDIEQELKNNYGFNTEFFLNPTRREIVDKLTKDLAKRSFQKDDQLLVYFSMHGHYEEGSQGALIPKDGLLEDASFDSWITHPNLSAWLNMIPCEHVLLSLDACYSGTFGGSRGAKPDKKPWETENDCASKTAKALQYKSRLYVTSGGVERTPTDSQFAKKWLEALRIRNIGGLLSFHSLFGVLIESSPVPMFGDFGSHVPGGDFVILNHSACKPFDDFAHWEMFKKSMLIENLVDHLKFFRKCPHTNEIVELIKGEKFGIQLDIGDSDGDLTYNFLDMCPNEFGTELFSGCPDSDEDGVPNNEDACPYLFGIPQRLGCPDKSFDARIKLSFEKNPDIKLMQSAISDFALDIDAKTSEYEARRLLKWIGVKEPITSIRYDDHHQVWGNLPTGLEVRIWTKTYEGDGENCYGIRFQTEKITNFIPTNDTYLPFCKGQH